MEYCGECQTAINKALSNIPVRYKAKYKEIRPTFGLDVLLNEIKENFNKARMEARTESIKFEWPIATFLSPEEGYDNIDTITHNGRTYRVEWNDETPGDKHYFIQMEFDLEKKDFTDRYWRSEKYADSHVHNRTARKTLERMFQMTKPIESEPLSEPKGSLFFTDFPEFNWDISTAKPAKKAPRHILHEWTANYEGAALKSVLKRKSVIAPPDFPIEDVNDQIEYEITIEKYEDEDFEKMTNIKIA